MRYFFVFIGRGVGIFNISKYGRFVVGFSFVFLLVLGTRIRGFVFWVLLRNEILVLWVFNFTRLMRLVFGVRD